MDFSENHIVVQEFSLHNQLVFKTSMTNFTDYALEVDINWDFLLFSAQNHFKIDP